MITWRGLDTSEARGHITGYKVSLSHNGTSLVESSLNPWLEARGLLEGRLYTVRVAGVTGAGVGPWSQAVLLDVGGAFPANRQDLEGDSDGSPSVLLAPPHPVWLLYLLVPILLIFLIGGVFYLRRQKCKSTPVNTPPGPPMYSSPTALYPSQHHVNMYGEQKLWRPSDSDKDSSVSSTRLLRPEHLINEYAEPRIHKLDDTTEPYATTALLAPSSPRHIRMQPTWRPDYGGDEGVQVNWAAFLPPPPSCPPPPEGDAISSSTTTESQDARMYSGASSQYDNTGGSEQYEKPCDGVSDHTYDLCTPPITSGPGHCRDPFLTFNSLQARRARAMRTEYHPPRVIESPRSNTH